MTVSADPSDSDALASIAGTCLGIASRAAARAATRALSAYFGPLELQPTQFPILVMVRLHGADGIAMLAERLDLDASALTRNVQILERRGLVAAEGGRGRRGKRLSLTPEGAALLERGAVRWRAAQAAIVSEMGADEAVALRRLLSRLETAAARAAERAAHNAAGNAA
jgi:DNA-binding MarR family transcriptional regulator